MEVDRFLITGALAGVITFIAFIFYGYDTLKGISSPNPATWVVWWVEGVLILSSSWEGGARETLIPTVVAQIGFSVMVLLLWKYGAKWSVLDKRCLVAALLSVIPWIITNDPVWTLMITLAIDLLGAWPTWKKAYHDPSSEGALPGKIAWALFALASIVNVFAINNLWDPYVAVYPFQITVVTVTMTVLVWLPRRSVREG